VILKTAPSAGEATQTAPSPIAIDCASLPTSTGAPTSVPVAGSMRRTVPLALATQT
jgi:hypothetical protein